MVNFSVISRFLVCLCIYCLLPVAESDDTVDCSTEFTDFHDDMTTFTVTCPAGCFAIWQAYVRGTGIYRHDSSICRAAIHDGRIPDDGGQVTVYRWPGQDSYQGSRQNGIQSYGWTSPRDSSFAFKPACRDALGMEDGTIKNGNITASSYQQSWPPWAARLNGDSAWFPLFTLSWIQVDLKQRKTVSGVITQGYEGDLADYWVTQYQVWYLYNNGIWAAVTSPTGNAMSFSGNTDPNSQKTNMFYRPIVTQQVRLYPTRWPWRSQPGLRMELLGCDLASTTQSTTAIRITYITTQPTTVSKTTSTTQLTTAMRPTSTTQSTNVIKTTSTTQPTTVTRTTSSISQSTAPAHTSPQTVRPFVSVTSSTAELIDGNHEEQKGAKGSISVGTIAGIAAGVAVVLIAIMVFVIVFIRKRQSSNKGASNVPRNAPEQMFRNPEYSGAALTNEHTAPAQDEGYTDCELYNNTEDNNPYETYNYANPGQISGGEISEPHDYDYVTIPGESARGVVDNVIYESSDMT